MNWADKAFEEIEKSYEDGDIDKEQYLREMRELRLEIRESQQCGCDDDY